MYLLDWLPLPLVSFLQTWQQLRSTAYWSFSVSSHSQCLLIHFWRGICTNCSSPSLLLRHLLFLQLLGYAECFVRLKRRFQSLKAGSSCNSDSWLSGYRWLPAWGSISTTTTNTSNRPWVRKRLTRTVSLRFQMADTSNMEKRLNPVGIS